MIYYKNEISNYYKRDIFDYYKKEVSDWYTKGTSEYFKKQISECVYKGKYLVIIEKCLIITGMNTQRHSVGSL